jgi:ketosteroid isomerase-like protein
MAGTTHLQIRELERRLRDAMRGSDLGELDALLADELIFTDHLGGLWRKADDMAAHRTGAIKVREVNASEERVMVLGGVAIVSVRLAISGTFGGREASGQFRFTRVWAQAGEGRWRVVAAHSTLVADRGAGPDGTEGWPDS